MDHIIINNMTSPQMILSPTQYNSPMHYRYPTIQNGSECQLQALIQVAIHTTLYKVRVKAYDTSKKKKYPRLQNSLDRQIHPRRVQRIGVERKHANVFTPEIKERLWSLGVIGYRTPKVLLNIFFFFLQRKKTCLRGVTEHQRKKTCLRGVTEHQTLRCGQLHRQTNPDRYIYTEFGSKKHVWRDE